jgi:hypothetical protein
MTRYAEMVRGRSTRRTYFDNIRVVQFAQVFDFAHGGHVETVLELANFNLLYSDFSTSREFSSCARVPALTPRHQCRKSSHTPIDDGICALSDFLVFDPV